MFRLTELKPQWLGRKLFLSSGHLWIRVDYELQNRIPINLIFYTNTIFDPSISIGGGSLLSFKFRQPKHHTPWPYKIKYHTVLVKILYYIVWCSKDLLWTVSPPKDFVNRQFGKHLTTFFSRRQISNSYLFLPQPRTHTQIPYLRTFLLIVYCRRCRNDKSSDTTYTLAQYMMANWFRRTIYGRPDDDPATLDK